MIFFGVSGSFYVIFFRIVFSISSLSILFFYFSQNSKLTDLSVAFLSPETLANVFIWRKGLAPKWKPLSTNPTGKRVRGEEKVRKESSEWLHIHPVLLVMKIEKDSDSSNLGY